MEIEAPLPEWLETWLNMPFYGGEKCRTHAKHYNTVYCVTCMEGPFCDFCWKDSKQHDGDHHQVLQVRRASERASIELKDIRKFIDVSEIQMYSINSKSIVFLNPHIEGASDASQKPYCLTCQRRLIKSNQSKQYKFCSIACKVQNKNHDAKVENKCDDLERTTSYTKIKYKTRSKTNATKIRKCFFNTDQYCSNIDQSSLFSPRKRSRKGIPLRSPLK